MIEEFNVDSKAEYSA